jgi:aspartate/methionine/tyrosine aminotransferase
VNHRIEHIKPFYVMELLSRAKTLEQQGRSIIHMEIGEPDFPTPQAVADAGALFVREGMVKYTPAAGLPELRDALADYYRKYHSVKIHKERIFITPGASGAFLLAMGLLIDSGNRVLLTDPGYPCYANLIHFLSGIPVPVPVAGTTNFQLSVDQVSRAWSSQTAGVVLASPSNPTGTVIDASELNCIIRFLEKTSGFLLADEIYQGLEYGKRAISALALSDEVFVVNSFSKYFGMTGWRIGWLIVPERFAKRVESLAQNIFISAPACSQYAALAAFAEDNFAELERRRLEFQKRRDFLCIKLQELGFRLAAKPDGAFYLYADCSLFGYDSFDLAWRLLEEVGVAVTPGKDFGNYKASCHVRFAYTAPIQELAEGVERIKDFLVSR